nr:RNA-directed DNA polymerase, eukaryota [Tanacetum cinerariifolium]
KDKNIREHKINEEESSLKYPSGFTPVENLNEGHLDGGCAKKVNEKVAGDDNSFVHTVGGKENYGSVNKMSDSMGSCRLKKSGMPRIKLMIVVVYAPQDASEKRMLWGYLTHVSNQWDGEIVMMGDFNEVRYKSERFGSNFKAHDADLFNSFIHNAGLNEVYLGGNRYISDHHPILLREAIFDYGPIPFRFYNYWLEVDGFDKLVRDAWNDAPGWLSTYRLNSRGALAKLKEDLRMFDEAIDKGNSLVEMVHKHLETLNKIQHVSNTHMRVRSGAEESQFNSLLGIVQVINLVPCEDRYFWSLESEGDYSVASIRKLIDEKRF